MTQNKTFKVVRILDEYRLVVNAGTDNRVTGNCYFEIVGADNEIIDPDTQENLGMLPGIKETVHPVIVEKKFCVCEYVEDRFIKTAEMMKERALLFTNSRKLNVNKKQMLKSGIDGAISVGDTAVFVAVEHKSKTNTGTQDIAHKKAMGLASFLSSFRF